MAFLAVFFTIKPAMEPFFVQDIGLHFLVAVLAQAVLCFLVELDVTLLALGFKFGVARDHLSGHKQ